MPEGKKVRTGVRTVICAYGGNLPIPPTYRVAYAMNEEPRLFILPR